MPNTLPNPAPDPRKPMIARACDFIDLQAGFLRVDRDRAEKILDEWRLADDLTAHERALVLGRYDTAS